MTRYLFGSAAAALLALGAGTAAQVPPPTVPPPAASAVQDQAGTVTVEGCLMQEAEVPGRKPNMAERAGLSQDYILTDAKVVKGAAPPAAAQTAPDQPTGTTGAVAMYDVKGLDGDQLKPFAGQRVQIDGTFADLVRSPSASPVDDLVDIRGTTIRPASGVCPPKQ